MIIDVAACKVCVERGGSSGSSGSGANIKWRAFVDTVAGPRATAQPVLKAAKRLVALARARDGRPLLGLHLRLDPDEPVHDDDVASVLRLFVRLGRANMQPGGLIAEAHRALLGATIAVVVHGHDSFVTAYVGKGLLDVLACAPTSKEHELALLVTRFNKLDVAMHSTIVASVLTDNFVQVTLPWWTHGEALALLDLIAFVVRAAGTDRSAVARILQPAVEPLLRAAGQPMRGRAMDVFDVMQYFLKQEILPVEQLVAVQNTLARATLASMDDITIDLLADLAEDLAEDPPPGGRKASRVQSRVHRKAAAETMYDEVELVVNRVSTPFVLLESSLRCALRAARHAGVVPSESASAPTRADASLREHVGNLAGMMLVLAATSSRPVPPSLLTTLHKARLHPTMVAEALDMWQNAATREAASVLLVRSPPPATAAVRAGSKSIGIRSGKAALCDDDNTTPVPVEERRFRRRSWTPAWERRLAAAALTTATRFTSVVGAPGRKLGCVCWNVACPTLDGDFDGQHHMLVCSRCLRACYCSVACQTAGWHAGHKHACATL
jgi:hypothetical protein